MLQWEFLLSIDPTSTVLQSDGCGNVHALAVLSVFPFPLHHNFRRFWNSKPLQVVAAMALLLPTTENSASQMLWHLEVKGMFFFACHVFQD